MKAGFFYAGVLFLLFSCGGNEKKTSSKDKDTVQVVQPLRDTVIFTIEDITKEEYCQFGKKQGFCEDKKNAFDYHADSLAEVELLKKHKREVYVQGNELVVRANKKELRFKNNTSEMSDNYVSYNVVDVKEGYVVLRVNYYESFEYMVINTENRKSFRTWGMPVFNKSLNKVLAGNYDLIAGFTNNGLQLFVNGKNGWELKMEKMMDDWGPSDMIWLNDSVILAKKNVPDETDTITGSKTSYVKILLKKETL